MSADVIRSLIILESVRHLITESHTLELITFSMHPNVTPDNPAPLAGDFRPSTRKAICF